MIDLFSVSAKPVPLGELVKIQFPESDAFAPVDVRPAVSGVILSDWLSANRDQVRSWLDDYGAVRFRGFALSTASDFSDAIAAYGATPLE
jgi:hypothetical protein